MKLRRTLGVTLAVFGLVVTASPAHAAVHRHSDAIGDVRQYVCEDMFDESTCTESASPALEPDIVSVAIRHERANVVVRIKQRDISRAGIRAHELRIVTNEGITRYAETVAWPGSARLEKELLRRDGDKVPCRRFSAFMDLTANMVTLTIPRSCMSYPRWVRVGIGAYTVATDGKTVKMDDAFLTNRVADRLVLSPVVRRG